MRNVRKSLDENFHFDERARRMFKTSKHRHPSVEGTMGKYPMVTVAVERVSFNCSNVDRQMASKRNGSIYAKQLTKCR